MKYSISGCWQNINDNENCEPGINPAYVRVEKREITSTLSASGSKNVPILDAWVGNFRAISPSAWKYNNNVNGWKILLSYLRTSINKIQLTKSENPATKRIQIAWL